MKSLLLLAVAMTSMLASFGQQKDKSKRPSPPAQAKETLANGTVVTIDYSSPSVKGRTIGKDIEPKDGQVWRAGANETTILEVSKPVKIGGKELAAGKYGVFVLANGGEWTFIINKIWDKWGTEYTESEDVVRVKGTTAKLSNPSEKLTYTIAKNGTVTLSWADVQSSFKVN
ncbi:MAG: DUF2911 domain-containing protein [Chitinophagaceae bacterium]|nr:MAG: DUF2911 domain-containing protein [Chitinophagaceae bacterium]